MSVHNLQELAQEYQRLFDTCGIGMIDNLDDTERKERVQEVIEFCFHVTAAKSAYLDIEAKTKVPWYVVALIHGMECDFNFHQHLHNGDSLRRRTVNEPAGRPVEGIPPFSWSFSAIDALQYDHFIGWEDWSVAGICFKLEGYNGWGYRKHGINSPYLWSYSNHYTRGKYVADGQWSADAVSRQVGAIVALKHLVESNDVDLDS